MSYLNALIPLAIAWITGMLLFKDMLSSDNERGMLLIIPVFILASIVSVVYPFYLFSSGILLLGAIAGYALGLIATFFFCMRKLANPTHE